MVSPLRKGGLGFESSSVSLIRLRSLLMSGMLVMLAFSRFFLALVYRDEAFLISKLSSHLHCLKYSAITHENLLN